MNRREEYNLLMKELEEVPAALEYTSIRFQAKCKEKRWHKWLGIPIGSILTTLTVFTILVNSVPVFAKGCSEIPIIKELAELVNFSSSLTEAVENEYIQPIEIEQSKGDITARVEYLIVDQKQVNVFYTVKSKSKHKLHMEPSIESLTGEALMSCSISSGGHGQGSQSLNYCTIDFYEENVPEQLKLIMEVYDDGSEEELENDIKEAIAIESQEDGRIHPIGENEEARKPNETFEFDLTFNPKYTAQGEKIPLNQNFQLDEQNFTIQEVEIYPTHMRFSIEEAMENTAYLEGMSYYIENEKGERFDKVKNGITASGKVGEPNITSYRVESSFFSNSKSLTLYITKTEWLDKKQQKVKIDLVHQKADYLPEGVTFEQAERKENGWVLTFGGIEDEEHTLGELWKKLYYDEAGNEHTVDFWSSVTCYMDQETGEFVEKKGHFYEEIPLLDYHEDVVYMIPSATKQTSFQEPIAIRIK